MVTAGLLNASTFQCVQQAHYTCYCVRKPERVIWLPLLGDNG